jgi:hypothetical protein
MTDRQIIECSATTGRYNNVTRAVKSLWFGKNDCRNSVAEVKNDFQDPDSHFACLLAINDAITLIMSSKVPSEIKIANKNAYLDLSKKATDLKKRNWHSSSRSNCYRKINYDSLIRETLELLHSAGDLITISHLEPCSDSCAWIAARRHIVELCPGLKSVEEILLEKEQNEEKAKLKKKKTK